MVERWIADSNLSTRFPIYTRANVGEVFPDPVTPLTRDFGISRAELGWRDAWVRMGAFDADEFDRDGLEQLGIAGGYCYLNASLIRLFGERAPGLSWQDIDAQFFGAQPGIPPYEEQPGDVRPDLTEKIGATFGWVLTTDGLPELIEDQRMTKGLRTARPDFAPMTDTELVGYGLGLIDRHFQYLFMQHLFITYCATVPVGIITSVCSALGEPGAVMRLISGVGDVDSAAPSIAMWDMGRLIAASPSLMALFEAGVPGLLDRAHAAARGGDAAAVEFLRRFDSFILEFGSRGPNEWEVRSPTWETQPALALSAIDRMRLSPDSAAPGHQNEVMAADRSQLGAELVSRLEGDPEAQGQFQAALRAATFFLPGRERTKTNAIRLIHECRMPLREVGRRMVERGHFDAIEDFGMLRRAELEAFVAGKADPAATLATIRERKAQYLDLSAHEPQFVFVGEPDFPAAWTRRDAVAVDRLGSGAVLMGVPGCPGVAEGRARVVLDSNDPTALQPGDVLVAPITDPSWTPLFVPAAAVVVDVGAPLSHAVIVSRELGIPCVVSATGATRRIPDGAKVRVDGHTGTVTVL